ncbi:E3 ubiquitin-protein ligase PDZRN3 [Culicoides brevitarsis]|uniref:E3 ubiquitin-protein ligase PDZRN3 n=1 Tax=Culicoides brevitarsis TaxID=469753 RepID=UPI00307BEBF4
MACMNFIILKVNGIDVSSFPHEDAVQVFLSAPEPIVVELKRRTPSNSDTQSSLNSSTTSSSRSSDSPTSDHPDDECLPPDIDIEEITLRKTKSEERIGLTVSYSSANGSGSDDTETCTEVFITDIIPESVAFRDGRLRQGDQILQVNGRDVTTKDETESLFAENRNAVTLLVSRCLYSDDDFFEEDFPPPPPPEETAVDQTDSNRLSNGSLILSQDDPLHHKNIKAQMEMMNQEIAALDHRVENAFLVKHDLQTYRQPVDSSDGDASVVDQKLSKLQISSNGRKPPQFPHIPAPPPIDSDTEHIYETIPEDSESEPIYCSPYESSDQSIVEQWLKMNGINNNQKQVLLKKIATNGGTGIKQSPSQETKSWQKTTKSNSSGEEHENSSSAYNTGGSCNSNNHLTLELNFSPDKDMSRSTMVLCPQKEAKVSQDAAKDCKQCIKHRSSSKEKSPKHAKSFVMSNSTSQRLTSPSASNFVHPQSTSLPGTPMSPTGPDFKDKLPKNSLNSASVASSTMYTNMANLHQTMLLQQKMFRQAMVQQNTMSNTKHYTAPNLSQYQFVSGQQTYRTSLQPRTNEENMVWKVKRRQDGTRYIVRRPCNRSKVLRERANKIAEERNELTTEDDTVSEIKLGRFWPKEDRKKHLEKAKERRTRQEAMIAAKNQQLAEQQHPATNGLPPTIPKSKSAETHRKPSTIKRQTKNGEPEKPPALPPANGTVKGGILSVTTV